MRRLQPRSVAVALPQRLVSGGQRHALAFLRAQELGPERVLWIPYEELKASCPPSPPRPLHSAHSAHTELTASETSDSASS